MAGAQLVETAVSTRPVDPRVADLVLFARSLPSRDVEALTDEELAALARDFWDRQHGED